jgi:hypothetical protein
MILAGDFRVVPGDGRLGVGIELRPQRRRYRTGCLIPTMRW